MVSSKIITVVFLATAVVVLVLIYLPLDRGEKKLTEFIIEKGDGSAKVAGALGHQNLVRSKYFFLFWAVFTGKEKEFKAGHYLISRSMSIPEIVRIMSEGLAESDDIAVTIPEGSNLNDIYKILNKAGLPTTEFLNRQNLELEGYLFPDTYRLNRLSVSDGRLLAGELIEKMRNNFREKMGGIFKDIDIEKIKETVIIASMLEKEVKTPEDMRLVAGIIYKRLERGMPLEIDATVAYGVCRDKFWEGLPCEVTLVNLVDNIPKDSVYNTYRKKGLPAGPISNPGLKAIEAALDPQESEYLFYLNARDGTTVFSKNASEHARARRKYLGI